MEAGLVLETEIMIKDKASQNLFEECCHAYG